MTATETLLYQLKQSGKKYIYEIDYYRYHNLVNWKIVFADNDNEAIKKAKVKSIIDVQIIGEL